LIPRETLCILVNGQVSLCLCFGAHNDGRRGCVMELH
jgi:hypothetical protein